MGSLLFMSMKDMLYKFNYFLLESDMLSKELYSNVEDALLVSRWWEEDNDVEDIKRGKTPLSTSLEQAANDAMLKSGLKTKIKVFASPYTFIDEEDQTSIFTSGEFVGDKNLLIFSLALGNTTDIPQFSPEDANFQFATMVRHELKHNLQLAKQAAAKGITPKKAFQQLLDDPRQVVDSDDPKYWEDPLNKEGFKNDLFLQDYLTRHIEVDAYAHQAAEKLLRAYGSQKALDVLSKDFNLQDPSLPDDVKKYKNYVFDKKKLNKFRSKVYSYIISMEDLKK